MYGATYFVWIQIVGFIHNFCFYSQFVSVFRIRIQECFGSGSGFQIQIQIRVFKNDYYDYEDYEYDYD